MMLFNITDTNINNNNIERNPSLTQSYVIKESEILCDPKENLTKGRILLRPVSHSV